MSSNNKCTLPNGVGIEQVASDNEHEAQEQARQKPPRLKTVRNRAGIWVVA